MAAKNKNIKNDNINTLLKEGCVIIKADSRETIYHEAEELVKQIPADVEWTRSIVEFCQGSFTQKYKLIKK